MIYRHPKHGAHPVVQPILRTWASAGFETSEYGYPIGVTIERDELFTQSFEHRELEVPWFNLLATIQNMPYFRFESSQEASEFFDALEQGLIPISNLRSGAAVKRYGPCELEVQNVHLRKSSSWGAVGFKPVTRCEHKIYSVEHKSTLRYKYYTVWKKAPNVDNLVTIVSSSEPTQPKHLKRGFTDQYISKDAVQVCEGNVKTNWIGVTEGTIYTSEGTFYTRAYSSPTRLQCEIP